MEDMSNSIDWNKFGSRYVKTEDGVKTTMLCSSPPRQAEKTFGTNPPRSMLVFSVLKHDGVLCDPPKVFEASAYNLIMKLRPIIEKAMTAGSATVGFSVVRMGTGPKTLYAVEELPQ
jgi:hypothetical protein